MTSAYRTIGRHFWVELLSYFFLFVKIVSQTYSTGDLNQKIVPQLAYLEVQPIKIFFFNFT